MANKRILGIDYGLRRVGFAISDPTQTIATSLGRIEVTQQLLQSTDMILKHIEKLIQEKNYLLETIVIGFPLNMDGSESDMCKRIKEFFNLLQTKTKIPLTLFDERLTTVQAERMLIQEVDLSRKKRKQVIDTLSAVVCLQNFLDRKKTTVNAEI